MKERIMITCPHCGKETPEGDVCRNCGKDIELAQGMEVHYKDFRGSEMLDIKMSSLTRQKDKKPARKETEALNKRPLPENKHAGTKAVFFFWATVVIILSAFAWYYLLKFLLKY
jgi:methionyl-tRNA synthetase